MRSLLVVTAICGCNWVYGIEQTEPRIDPDFDGDEVADQVDNCPMRANADQADVDEDTIGDRCDNCPLEANVDQSDSGDGDSVGDICDPHPTTPGDCLVLFDTFESADIAAHWNVSSSSTPPVVTASDGGTLTVVPLSGTTVFLLALDDNGSPLQGVFDGQLDAVLAINDGSVYLVSNAAAPAMGYGCFASWDQMSGFRVSAYTGGPGGGSSTNLQSLSNEPVSADVSLRLISPSASDVRTRCQVELGFAAANVSVNDPTPGKTSTPTAGGAPGVRLDSMAAILDTLVLYRAQSTACEPTIYR